MAVIPQVDGSLTQDFTLETLPSRTLKLRLDTQTIAGEIDRLQAVEQAVF